MPGSCICNHFLFAVKMSVSLLAAVVATRSVREGLLWIWSDLVAGYPLVLAAGRRDALHRAALAIDRRARAIIFSILPGRSSRDVVADQSCQTYKSCNQKLKLIYSKSFKKS